MHADLIAIRAGLNQLDSLDVKAIDCRLFGLSPSEPVNRVRQVADEWKQPFQQEYTERTVNEAFEKLLCLRTDVEKALEKVAPKQPNRLTMRPSHLLLAKEPVAAPVRAAVKEPAKNGESLNTSASYGFPLLRDRWEAAHIFCSSSTPRSGKTCTVRSLNSSPTAFRRNRSPRNQR